MQSNLIITDYSSDEDIFQYSSTSQLAKLINSIHFEETNDLVDREQNINYENETQNQPPFNQTLTELSDSLIYLPSEEQIFSKADFQQVEESSIFTQMDIQNDSIQEKDQKCQIDLTKDPKSSKIKKPNRDHTRKSRRRKFYQTAAQQSMIGDWRKNLLQFAKTSHVDFWKKLKRISKVNFFAIYTELQEFRTTVATKEGFVNLYKVQSLRPYFVVYFRTKVLYRDLMVSRALIRTKLAYSGSINLFQKAFIQKKFDSIM